MKSSQAYCPPNLTGERCTPRRFMSSSPDYNDACELLSRNLTPCPAGVTEAAACGFGDGVWQACSSPSSKPAPLGPLHRRHHRQIGCYEGKLLGGRLAACTFPYIYTYIYIHIDICIYTHISIYICPYTCMCSLHLSLSPALQTLPNCRPWNTAIGAASSGRLNGLN